METPSRFLQLLLDHKETRNSVYHFVKAIENPSRHPRGAPLSPGYFQPKLLETNGLSESKDELGEWRSIVNARNIDHAVALLHQRGFVIGGESVPPSDSHAPYQLNDTHSPPSKPKLLPPWIIFYLISHKVRAPPHATGIMLSLTLAYLNHLPPDLRGGLIIMSVFQLAKFNAVLPMQLLTSQFLQLDFTPKHHASDVSARNSKIHFNLLLQAIARNPIHSIHAASSTVTLLKAMDTRKLALWQDTCDELLRDRFVVMELTKWLRERAVWEGYVPMTGQLDEYVRLFTGPKPAIEDDEDYEKAVAEMRKDKGFFTARDGKEDRLSAIRFLESLVETSSSGSSAPAVRPPELIFEEEEQANDTEFNGPTPTPLPDWFYTPSEDFQSLPRQLQSEWISGFRRAARDISQFSAREVINFFEWGIPSSPQHKSRVRPTLGLYTELIRALLVRGERSSSPSIANSPDKGAYEPNGAFLLAEQYFQHLRSIGFPLDAHAVAVGLEALTRVGKPHKAFALLSDHCLVERAPTPCTVTETVDQNDEKPNTKDIFPKTRLSAIAMADFMVALMRIGRYDCVFWLFQNSVRLFSVWPSNRAISVLLQSARKSQRADGEMHGGWKGFWLFLKQGQATRRKEQDPAGEMYRGLGAEGRETAIILREIEDIVGSRDNLVPYKPGRFWEGETLLSRIQRIFWSCVVGQAWTRGMAPVEGGKHGQFIDTDRGRMAVDSLLAITSPARPLPRDSDSFLDSLRVPFPVSPHEERVTLASLLRGRQLDPHRLPSYPQVVLQDTHFRDYILLLGLASQERPLFSSPSHSSLSTSRKSYENSQAVTNAEPSTFVPPIAEVPLVLAWQRYLGVQPSRDTIAAAMILFGEHGGDGDVPPLVDEFRRWRGRKDEMAEVDELTFGWGPKGEYAKFVRWIEDWVGEVEASRVADRSGRSGRKNLMPDSGIFTKWRKNILRMRES
ncbi:hypothetical protein PQX77_015588 [Marasmius sp. AFHP31]|nr:hypothetical protein PQX77_015588 [Marasmius sp. AFHP31]